VYFCFGAASATCFYFLKSAACLGTARIAGVTFTLFFFGWRRSDSDECCGDEELLFLLRCFFGFFDSSDEYRFRFKLSFFCFVAGFSSESESEATFFTGCFFWLDDDEEDLVFFFWDFCLTGRCEGWDSLLADCIDTSCYFYSSSSSDVFLRDELLSSLEGALELFSLFFCLATWEDALLSDLACFFYLLNLGVDDVLFSRRFFSSTSLLFNCDVDERWLVWLGDEDY
jgi:hypothetical protein